MPKVSLDNLDRRLIKLLGYDARISNRKIASDLDVTEGTIRSRIKRLEQENLIRFTAITRVQRKDKYRMAFIRVQAELERVPEICAELEAMDTVGALLVTMGRFNLLVVVLFDDLDELHEIAAGKILSRPGVHHVETAIAVDTVKYDVRIARIL